MQPIVRVDLGALIATGRPLVLELGCGRHKAPGRVGIDRVDGPGVDIVADIERGLPFVPDGSVDEVHANSFFEHVEDLEGLVRELVRVLKKDGRCHVFVPHFSNPYAYSDYTHKRFMGLYTFYYFVDERHQLRRKVPNHYCGARLRVVSQRLVIADPFARGRWFKRLLERVFNASPGLQEFYEANLCFLFPCYGLRVVIAPDK